MHGSIHRSMNSGDCACAMRQLPCQDNCSTFGSTYVCEQLFSRMKYAKNKLRTRLKDDHLETVMRLSTSTISPDVIRLSKDGQHQKSH